MAEAAKCDRRVANIALVSEHDLENGDISNDRRRDSGDQEEDGCDEQEGHADPVYTVSVAAGEKGVMCATNQ
jgi:hypothetical protein